MSCSFTKIREKSISLSTTRLSSTKDILPKQLSSLCSMYHYQTSFFKEEILCYFLENDKRIMAFFPFLFYY